jgi:ACR3 family arsenite efflux pump ArsB
MVAVGLLVMMYPILCKVRYETLHNVLGKRDIWTQILFSVVVNWVIAPLVMVCLSELLNSCSTRWMLICSSSVWRGLSFRIRGH